MRKISAAVVVVVATSAASSGDIVKGPDLGEFWWGLNPDFGSWIYADSFVADETGPVSDLGTWLRDLGSFGGTASLISFEVYGSIGGDVANGPDSSNVIASTGVMDLGGGTVTLEFYHAAPGFSGVLNAGETYWFAASVVDADPNQGLWQAGAHTQNSVYSDNGTFWFSNDRTGEVFDGRAMTPEMAFSISIGADSCPADIDGDGDADADDFFGYLDLFASDNPDADIDGDGDIDADDFFGYLDQFVLGC